MGMERNVGVKREYKGSPDQSAMTRALAGALAGLMLKSKRQNRIGRGRRTLYTYHKGVSYEGCSPDFTKFELWSRQRKRRFFMEVEKQTRAKRRVEDRRQRVLDKRSARRAAVAA